MEEPRELEIGEDEDEGDESTLVIFTLLSLPSLISSPLWMEVAEAVRTRYPERSRDSIRDLYNSPVVGEKRKFILRRGLIGVNILKTKCARAYVRLLAY